MVVVVNIHRSKGRVFDFLVLFVSSQVYHLCSLLLITNFKALPLIGLMDYVVVANHRNLDYKLWKFAWVKGFVCSKKTMSTLFRFCVFGKSISIECHCV
jgi:hypothetical protein